MMNESGAARLVATIEQSPVRMISAGTVIEASVLLHGHFGELNNVQLSSLLRGIEAAVVTCDAFTTVLA